MEYGPTSATDDRQQLQEDLTEQFWPALLGELAGPMTHEFNNFLNTLLLEISVLETEVAETSRAELAIIQKHAAAATRLIKYWQEYRQRRPGQCRPVDLNQVIRQVTAAWRGASEPARSIDLASLAGSTAKIELELVEDLPPVLAFPTALHRVLFFLLKSAATAQGDSGQAVIIRTGRAGDYAQMRIEDAGPPLNEAVLHQMFDLVSARQGPNPLELAACSSIVRRLEGKIRGFNLPEGKVAIVVELPMANAQ